MPSKAAELFVDEEGGTSSRPDWIRSSYDFLIVIPESRRMTYGGEFGSSDDMKLSSDWFGNGEASDFMIFETGSGILLMVPRASTSLCCVAH